VLTALAGNISGNVYNHEDILSWKERFVGVSILSKNIS